ncbi:MAG: Eco29kI family restriction endonuclease [Gallionellaceae bacterium]|nr:Eco29kI family restriction endonuclease [Gallionellaceae bacterium]
MSDNVIPFNPLDKRNLGASVAEALLTGAPKPLADIPSFQGAGVYALYYVGDFPAYRDLAETNKGGRFQTPIYVGKAIPAGARKGGGLGEIHSRALYKRLSEHAESIRAVENLDIQHFHCRYLVVDDIWIPLGESLLIARFAPVWNSLVDGFGNHDPGKGRHQGLRPRWDVLHPGREWAIKCREREETADLIARDVEVYLRS